MPAAYYEAIMDNRTYVQKRKMPFQFRADAGEGQLKKRQRAVRRPPGPGFDFSVVPAAGDDDEGTHTVDSESSAEQSQDASNSEAGGQEGQEDEAHCSAASGHPSGAASSSSDSRSSSTSNSSESESAQAPASAPPPPLGQEHAPAAHGAQGPFCETQRWKGFKFTKVMKGGTTHWGWEATCYNKNHSLPGNPCRKTKIIGPQGDEVCQRKLMWWCLHCHVATRIEHRDVPELPTGGMAMLPSLEQLHAVPLCLGVGGVVEDHRARGCLLV
jgi:hypothetical protein